MKPEFEIGEIVTFKAFEKAIKAKVTGINIGLFGGKFPGGTKDSRVIYDLSGVNEPLKSYTSGLCILESRFFMFMNTLHEQAMEKLSGEWQRPKEFTDRPEVVRDLLEYGVLECKKEISNAKTGESICYYR